MSAIFIPDLDDVRRAQGVIGGYTRTRLEIIAARPGNPLGAEARRFGGAVALRAPGFPNSAFNRAYGFCDDQIDEIPALIDWYAAGAGGAFELAPGRPIARTARLLAEAGYAQTGFHATFAGPAELPDAPSPGVEVIQVESEDELKAFADVFHLGWDITGFRVPVAPWLGAPGWSLYLARCDGEPAGMAIVYVDGADAYLADSAVDPRFRRRGVHRALLDRRCDDARDAGATRIYSGADFLSASSRNMQRKGLVLLYTEAILSRPQPKAAG
ncbi:MAG TPA: GNAT family N-acetyltransferase [Caulobacteraceae bacterium]|jgi:GNAT superfamily N-acetyltransferase|nr:GNAT family N-acetyltransferase [Caulobacteraceae bacterium]